MADDRPKAEKSVRVQTNEKPQHATGATVVERPAGMPNPVKGLKLSLYPIIREH